MEPDTQNKAQDADAQKPDTAATPAKNAVPFTRPADPSKYMRTYAKDVAMLTNTPMPAPTPAPAAQEDTPVEGVALPEYDSSPVNRPDGVSSKEFPQEDVVLTKEDSDGIFNAKDAQAEADRAAVLARLRAKLASKEAAVAPAATLIPSFAVPTQPIAPPIPASEETATPTPSAPTPAPAPESAAPVEELPLRTAAPAFATSLETSFPPIPPVAASVRAQEYAPVAAQQAPADTGPSPLHTYSSDFTDHIARQNGSTFSVLAAQSDAGQAAAPRPARRRNLLPLIAGGAMLVIGLGAVTGAYLFSRNSSAIPMVASVPSLISFDESVEVKGSGETLMDDLAHLADGGSVSGNVIVTYVTTPDASGGVAGAPQPGGTLIRALSLPAPDILLRNIDESSTVGVVKAGSETRPFFLLKVNSYERTFAGMLAWEATMANDLSALYPAYVNLPEQVTTSSTTASSTPTVVAPASPLFTDATVNNHDVRILRDGSGRSLLLYGYLAKDMLVIARDEAAFTALATRLSASGH